VCTGERVSAISENKMGARLRLGQRVLFWTTIRRGLTAAGAMFSHHFHSFVFIGAQSDTAPIRKHEPLIGTNLLDCVFSHFSAQPAENLRIHGRSSGRRLCPCLDLFKEGDFALQNAELWLCHVAMVSPDHPRSGFDLRYLPTEEAKLIG
jgi:hypothetical protein